MNPIVAGIGAGFAGWVLENAADGPRYSHVFGNGSRAPFLPVYAAGGAMLALLVPAVEDQPRLVRYAIYGAALTALEGAAGLAERKLGQPISWSYGSDAAPIDASHAFAWTALAALAEPLLR